ncbi:MAG TPA: rhodanese-like domain-containing protein [Actinomycetota bacterium]|nr:rhodanese-like domain-containing protein [Actinomycetota bacterium]
MGMTSKQMLDEARQNVPEISAPDAKEKLDKGEFDLILDVREPAEWQNGHLEGAIHIPRGLLEFQADPTSPMANAELTAKQDARILVHCAKGARSLLAADTLKKMGYENVASIAGGYDDCAASGFAIEKE